MKTMICDSYDVVEVPFPFSDLPRAKRRKALVLSPRDLNDLNGATILMMITSANRSSWHWDVPVKHLDVAGLSKACVARLKLFTLDNGLIRDRVGQLHPEDAQNVQRVVHQALPSSEG